MSPADARRSAILGALARLGLEPGAPLPAAIPDADAGSTADFLLYRGLLPASQREEFVRELEASLPENETGATAVLGDRDSEAGGARTEPLHATSTPEAVDALPRRLGRYELTAELGQGGMGVVYRARDLTLDREVALKVLGGEAAGSAEMRARFLREARTAARLNHPGVVAVHDCGEADGCAYLAMELVAGTSLERALEAPQRHGIPPARRGPAGAVEPRWALGLVRRVAEALHHAHGAGVVHRDVKPGNILLDGAGRPRVADFGLAKDLLEQAPSLTGSMPVLLGTPDYMSPEQAAQTPAGAGAPSDQYSLALVLVQLLTGKVPHVGGSTWQTLNARMSGEAPSPLAGTTGLPRGIEAVCRRALARNPAERYPTMAEFARELERLESHCRPALGRALRVGGVAAAFAATVAIAWMAGALAPPAPVPEPRAAIVNPEPARDANETPIESPTPTAVAPSKEDPPATPVEPGPAGTPVLWEAVVHAWVAFEDEGPESATAPSNEGREDEQVTRFLAAVPPDAAARAAAYALAGWSLRARGREAEGDLLWARALDHDPDSPVVLRVAAWREFHRALAAWPWPETRAYRGGVGAWWPAQAIDRLRMPDARAPAIGPALPAELDTPDLVAGLKAPGEGRPAEAEIFLSRLMETRMGGPLRAGLLRARAAVRLLLGRPAECLTDLEQAGRDRAVDPDDAVRLGTVHTALAAAPGMNAARALPECLRAEECLTAFVEGNESRLDARRARGGVRLLRAQFLDVAGADREAALRAARADFEAAAAGGDADASREAAVGRVVAGTLSAELALLRGEPATDALGVVWADVEALLAKQPEDADLRAARGWVRLRSQQAAPDAGEHGRAAVEAARADFSFALERRPGFVWALAGRAEAALHLAGLTAAEAEALCADAVLHYDRALEAAGPDVELLMARARALSRSADLEASAGRNPTPMLQRTLEAVDLALHAGGNPRVVHAEAGSASLRLADLAPTSPDDRIRRLATARSHFQSALAAGSDAPSVHSGLGWCEFHRAETLGLSSEEAAAAYGDAGMEFERSLDEPGSRTGRGLCRLRLAERLARARVNPLQECRAAIDDFCRALEKSPADAAARVGRGWAYALELGAEAISGVAREKALHEAELELQSSTETTTTTSTGPPSRIWDPVRKNWVWLPGKSYSTASTRTTEERKLWDRRRRIVLDLDAAMPVVVRPAELALAEFVRVHAEVRLSPRDVAREDAALLLLARRLDKAITADGACWRSRELRAELIELTGDFPAAAAEYEQAQRAAGGADPRLSESLSRARVFVAAESAKASTKGMRWITSVALALGRGDHRAALAARGSLPKTRVGAPRAAWPLVAEGWFLLARSCAAESTGGPCPWSTAMPKAPDGSVPEVRPRDRCAKDAFLSLWRARDFGFADLERLRAERDLLPLHSEAEWAKVAQGR